MEKLRTLIIVFNKTMQEFTLQETQKMWFEDNKSFTLQWPRSPNLNLTENVLGIIESNIYGKTWTNCSV